MMHKGLIELLGDDLYKAMRTFRPLQPLVEQAPDITIDDAYYISLSAKKLV